jgi:hypothetical protein
VPRGTCTHFGWCGPALRPVCLWVWRFCFGFALRRVALLCGVWLRLHPVLFPAGGPFLPSLSVQHTLWAIKSVLHMVVLFSTHFFFCAWQSVPTLLRAWQCVPTTLCECTCSIVLEGWWIASAVPIYRLPGLVPMQSSSMNVRQPLNALHPRDRAAALKIPRCAAFLERIPDCDASCAGAGVHRFIAMALCCTGERIGFWAHSSSAVTSQVTTSISHERQCRLVQPWLKRTPSRSRRCIKNVLGTTSCACDTSQHSALEACAPRKHYCPVSPTHW